MKIKQILARSILVSIGLAAIVCIALGCWYLPGFGKCMLVTAAIGGAYVWAVANAD